MKTLYLLRHAKSSWAEHGLSDQQRPLSERGLRDAPMMGKRFSSRDENFERIVASPALRAQQTAELFAEACDFPAGEIETDSNLYFLGSGLIEDLIQSQSDQVNSLMLVFHNPDITWFANAIEDDVRIDNVPTCGLIRLSCDLPGWDDWTRAQTSFEYFDYPKNLSDEVITR